jgi:hypothetical protein
VTTRLLAPRHFRKIRHTVPPGRRVEILVEANGPVDIHVVPEDELEEFRTGNPISGPSYYDYKRLSKRLRLPFEEGSGWYLVIDNTSDEPRAVHYDVFY